ncbi:MAG: RNA polymerase sigma factor [Clostridiales bacterium]|nr:RNA polymerase sigma factor [Clostridiales bacterium]
MDAETFKAEYLHHERLFYRVSYSMLGNNDDCADAIQDTLLRAWERRSTLRNIKAFRPWIMRILTNICTDILRKRSKLVLVPFEESEQQAVMPAPSSPLPLKEAMDQLSPQLRVATLLYYIEGYSVKEIAQMLDVPQGTVKSRLLYARQNLQKLLHEEMEDMQ